MPIGPGRDVGALTWRKGPPPELPVLRQLFTLSHDPARLRQPADRVDSTLIWSPLSIAFMHR